MAIDYKEKIRKLLALAESPNENEAKCALLKAKQLMAEHKIAEIDLEEIKFKKVKRIETKYTFTKRGEWWISDLAQIIAANYCCRSAGSHYTGSQKRTIIFVGLEDDVDLCNMVFSYAVESARALAKEHCKEVAKQYPYGLSTADKNVIKNSYASGFAKGVMDAFREQQKAADESTWGLVMVVPKEVNDSCKNFRTDRHVSKHAIHSESKDSGYKEGKRFNPDRRIS